MTIPWTGQEAGDTWILLRATEQIWQPYLTRQSFLCAGGVLWVAMVGCGFEEAKSFTEVLYEILSFSFLGGFTEVLKVKRFAAN